MRLNLTLLAGFLFLFILYASLNRNSTISQYDESMNQKGGAMNGVNGESSMNGVNGGKPNGVNGESSMNGANGEIMSEANGESMNTAPSTAPGTAPPAQTTQSEPTIEQMKQMEQMSRCAEPRDNILNPQYPVESIPSEDNKQNTINRQRRLIREYQSYIKNLRGQCCRRLYSGANLMNNPLSNKEYNVMPTIATTRGNENALYLMTDDFSNVLSISPGDAEKYKVSFYDGQINPPRTYALNASSTTPIYDKGFDRAFVGRIPDPPINVPFKVTPWSDWPGSGANCPASRGCPGTFSPPWSTNKAFSCQGIKFNPLRAPEPGLVSGNVAQAPPYSAGQSPPPVGTASAPKSA